MAWTAGDVVMLSVVVGLSASRLAELHIPRHWKGGGSGVAAPMTPQKQFDTRKRSVVRQGIEGDRIPGTKVVQEVVSDFVGLEYHNEEEDSDCSASTEY